MSQGRLEAERATLRIENIGGISESTVELGEGVTVLAGRNATNRTSLLQAIMAVLGSENVSLKGDAEEGFVELAVGDRTWTRRLQRRNGTLVTSGDPFLEDATLADLFAFLLESNGARRAIAQNGDLREILMRPVDTSAIEADIDRLSTERQRLEEEIEELESLEQQLPELEERRNELEEELEDRREALESLEADIDEFDADVDEQREERAELEEKLDQLSDVRSQLETVRYQLDSERESVEALRDERTELESEAETIEDVSEERIDGIAAEIQRLREQITEVESEIDELQTVIQFNENVLDGDFDLFAELRDDSRDGDVTDELLTDDDELVCWTCGNETDSPQIEAMVDRLRDIHAQRMKERSRLESEIEELKADQRNLRERQERRDEIRERLARIGEEIDERESRIEDLRDQRRELTDRVEELEADANELRSEDQGDLLELHKEANRLEVEIERTETDLESVEAEIERIETDIAERDQLESQREELQEEIEYLRTRVERLEQQAVEEFNEHMGSMLDILEYENLERIWIERTEREVREGRRTVTKGHFELHVVRATEAETVYEDTVQHLSESEREVTGLVFALAGYLAHEVYDELPFILLDSVEALDSDRIATLIEYLEEFADYLVVALLEEDAAALDDGYRRITDI